ncbi:MupG family TIM beta-alpha barrel fold protein [Streptococcus merionis]|uniref:Outer surface protein n=1 Tax=Streptococcus merionis TaxID=400065 RepID=A0A239SQH8_9STRE|nr:MupG family TIM beta-alpha barrel fold protein [Streptococcus merionis]SNU87657.1 outer surface protein [Streptococcus merionis]
MEDKVFFSHLGFSLYISQPFQKNQDIVLEYKEAGFSFAFTSLNITEEGGKQHQLQDMVRLCQKEGIALFVDINAESFGCLGIDGLKELGCRAVRVDDGLSEEDIVQLSQVFLVVCNASTLTVDALKRLQKKGLNPNKVMACHNYYPKTYTGLSMERLCRINEELHRYAIPVIAFVPGDEYRMPLFEGLPTVEEHRAFTPLQASVDCLVRGGCDYVCVGDTRLSFESLIEMSYLSKRIIPLKANVPDACKGLVFENRIDKSDYVIRAAHSRSQLAGLGLKGHCVKRYRGDIVLANAHFLRYENELEICLVDLPKDSRQEVIGSVEASSRLLLDAIEAPFSFVFL